MGVVVGKMLAILEAQTAVFEARMTAAGKQLDHFTRTTSSARQGVALMKTGMQSLALEGFGALPGPLARVATGFGVLALGSPLIIGVLGAAAAVGMAMKKVGDDSQAAADNAIAGMERIRKNLDAFVKSHGNAEGRETLEARLAERQAHLDELRRQLTGPRIMRRGEEFGDALQEDIAGTKDSINQLTVALANLNAEMARLNQAQWKDFFKDQNEFLASLPPISMDFAQLGDIRTRGLADVNRSIFEEPFRVPLQAGEDAIANWANGPGGIAFETHMRDVTFQFDELTKGLGKTEQAAQRFSVMLAGAVANALLGLAHAQGPAGFAGAALSGAGGILSTFAVANPALALPSVILGGLGGIFSLFDHSEDERAAEAERANERRHKELIQALEHAEPIIIPVGRGDFTDPRELDLLVAAIEEARSRRILPAAA